MRQLTVAAGTHGTTRGSRVPRCSPAAERHATSSLGSIQHPPVPSDWSAEGIPRLHGYRPRRTTFSPIRVRDTMYAAVRQSVLCFFTISAIA